MNNNKNDDIRGGLRRPFIYEVSESHIDDVLVAYEQMDNQFFSGKKEITITSHTTSTKNKRRFFK